MTVDYNSTRRSLSLARRTIARPRAHHLNTPQFLIENARLEFSATSTKQDSSFESNRERIEVLPLSSDRRFHAESYVTHREVDAAEEENQAANRRENLLKSAAASGLLLTLGVYGVRRNRSAAPTGPATATRSAAAAGPATSARSAAAALSAAAVSGTSSARTTACIATAARAASSARRRRAGRDTARRRVHAVRIRLAEGIDRRKNDQGDHRREQRVLGRVLSRFLPPDSFEECLHDKIRNGDEARTTSRELSSLFYSPFLGKLQPVRFAAQKRPGCLRSACGSFALSRDESASDGA